MSSPTAPAAPLPLLVTVGHTGRGEPGSYAVALVADGRTVSAGTALAPVPEETP